MAVPIDAFTVVIRNQAVAEKYIGALNALRDDSPNSTYCCDEHLSRVSFMTLDDAKVFVARLAAKGLTPASDGKALDVAMVSDPQGPLQECDWLEFAEYEKAMIVWLAGQEHGDLVAPAGWEPKKLNYMTAEEIREQLEYVRTDDNVQVYRDKTTGQEVYVGRTEEHPDEQRHDELYRQAVNMIEGLIRTHGETDAELDSLAMSKLSRASAMLEEVVEMNPSNWSAMWLLGKVAQRLDDHHTSFEWFARAHRVNPDQPDVAREGAIAAMDSGRPEDGIPLRRAVEVCPEDAGLWANLALALLFTEQVDEAAEIVATALAMSPEDQITQTISQIIESVRTGERPCPHHVRDLS